MDWGFFATAVFWMALVKIMAVNILMSSDNAVVIALASRNLPPKEQKMAVIIGSAGAIVALVILAFFATAALEYNYVKLVGSALLLWVGIKLLVPEEEGENLDAASNLMGAVKTIIIADCIMSLDNVLGMVGVANAATDSASIRQVLLCIGLAISTPVIIFGSTLLMKLMDRFPVIITIGGAFLGYVAGEMVLGDGAIKEFVEANHWLHYASPIAGAILVYGIGKFLAMRHQHKGHSIAA